MARCVSVVLAAFAAITLSACGSDAPSVTSPVGTTPAPSPSMRAPDEPVTARILTRLVGRTGRWRATLGKPGDRGDLTVRDQLWSLLVARGQVKTGGEWPPGAPEIEPGG